MALGVDGVCRWLVLGSGTEAPEDNETHRRTAAVAYRGFLADRRQRSDRVLAYAVSPLLRLRHLQDGRRTSLGSPIQRHSCFSQTLFDLSLHEQHIQLSPLAWVIRCISKPAQNDFQLVRACPSSYELGQAKKAGKHHKCQSNLFFW